MRSLALLGSVVLALQSSTLATASALQSIAQEAYLKSPSPGNQDFFGRQVAISGDTVVVASVTEDSNATGVNGDSSNNDMESSGAVYVFVRNGGTWSFQAYLKASNTNAGDAFGIGLAISGDTIVVGAPSENSSSTGVNGDQSDNSAPSSGAAYVFVRNGTTWSQEAYLKASNTDAGDRFGWSVGIDGDTVVVSATEEDSNATGVNGDEANDDETFSGAAYVFVRSGTTWSQEAYLKASNSGSTDQFGGSVAISQDTVVVGAHNEDSSATGVNGNQNLNSASNSGAAYVFVRNGTAWSQEAYLKASNTDSSDAFGFVVAISGDTVAVGSPTESSSATGVDGDQSDDSLLVAGAAYVFVRNGTTWSQQAYLKASNPDAFDAFNKVAISGDTLVVGTVLEDSNATCVDGVQGDNSVQEAGAVYVFSRTGTTWAQAAYLKASNTEAGDNFGTTAISGDTLVVGAGAEASAATGVGGDQSNNSLAGSGAAFVFDLAAVDDPGAPFCFGEGSGTACPCSGTGALGAGCANSATTGAVLVGSGSPRTSCDTFTLSVTNSAPSTPGLMIQGSNALSGGNGNPVGNGLLCVGPQKRWFVQVANASGSVTYGPGLFGTNVAATPGTTLLYQWWYRDAADACGNGFNFSNGWSVTWQ